MLVFIWILLFSATTQISAEVTDNQDVSEVTSTATNSTNPTSAEGTVTNVTAITTITQSEVNSDAAQAPNNTTSRNDTNGDVKPIDLLKKLLEIVKQPQVIIAFFIGVLLSSIICCLITKCNRKKQRGSKDIADSLEMVTTQAVPLIQDGQAVDDGDDGTLEPETANGGAGAVEPKEVEYSNIDFSVLKGRSPTEAEETPDPTETEYAEIKKDAPVEGQGTAGEESEAMEGNIEEGAMTEEGNEEGKEPEQHEPVKDEGGEDVAVYSNVYEVMDETC